MKTNSEFGKGFIYCLLNFAKHFDKAFLEIQDYKDINKKDSEALSSWINGASDHLYEIQIPTNLPFKIKKEIEELKDMALEYGHGSKMMMELSFDKYKEMRERLNNIALMIDKWLKVKVCKASWD